MLYYISDLHFFHERIITLCNRPYKTVDEMNADMIQKWNAKVTDNDIVYVLGDFAFKGDYENIKKIFNQLKGRKRLILGNHDNKVLALPWDEVAPYKEIYDMNRYVVLFHYPIEEWNGFFRGSYHLYGHVHNCQHDYKVIERRYNVGADVVDFTPRTLDELIELNQK